MLRGEQRGGGNAAFGTWRKSAVGGGWVVVIVSPGAARQCRLAANDRRTCEVVYAVRS